MLRSTLLIVSAFASSTFALVQGVDSSTLVSEATYSKAKGEGFTKAIIRGYEEACGVGGQVDPNFVGSYNNARAAGYTNIDVYLFPCTGSTNSCKSYATQISELGATFNAHSMKIGKIWIDIEKDSTCNNVCSNHFIRSILTDISPVELWFGWQSCRGQENRFCDQSGWIQLWNLQQPWSKPICFIFLLPANSFLLVGMESCLWFILAGSR